MIKKVKFLAEINQTLDDCNLQTYARLVRKHPLNEIRINTNVSREEIFNYLRRVPVEILVEVYDENFVDEEEIDHEEDEDYDNDVVDEESEEESEEDDDSDDEELEDDD
jgi:hypothetical protein